MTATHAAFAATLRSNRQSLTTARKTVFSALQYQEPLTMHELVARCPGINRASVYRCIELFIRFGIAQRLQTGWKYRLELSDDYHEHHHHATCTLCNTSIVLPESQALERNLHSAAQAINFQVEQHQIELQGYCQVCQELLKD